MGTTGFTIIDLIILIVYLLAVLVAGIYFSKKEMKGKEFFKGDGSVPWYVTSVSIFATMLSPISFLGLAGNSYAGSWILWFAQLGMVVAIPLTIRFILPIFARIDIDTAYDYLDKRFNSKALRIISALLFIIYQLGRMSIIMYLPSAGLSVLTGIDINILIILMGAIATVFYLIGTGLYVFYQVQNAGSAASNIPQDQIFMYFIAYQLPVGVTGLILAAIYAAAQSTVSTGLNSVATSWTLDIQDVISKNMSEDRRTKIAQFVSLAVGLFSIVVSIIMAHSDIKSAYEWFNSFMGLVLGLLGGVFILGFVSKKANKQGAYAALIVSTIVMVFIKYFLPPTAVSYWAYSLISISVSVVSGYIVSVLTENKVSAPKYTTIHDILEIKADSSWEVRH